MKDFFQNNPITPEDMIEYYWKNGFLRYLLKPDLQLRVYDFTHDWKKRNPDSALPIVWDLHRAAGKTFELALLGLERGFRYPGQEVRFGASTISQADEIVEPNIRKILDHRPQGFIAERRVDQSQPYYILINPYWEPGSPPSYFRLIGCRERADKHRGKRSNMILLDECRDIEAFEYISKVVFAPHFATMFNPVFIMSSTPPESMDHPFTRIYCPQAIEGNRYIKGPVTEDKDWTDRDNKMMLEMFHDVNSPEWKREMLCEHISDPTRLVIPEFEEGSDIRDSYDRPKYFYPLIVADGGYVDYFACLFGYVDFLAAKLIVEDSIVVNRKHMGELNDLIVEKRSILYGIPEVSDDGKLKVTFPVKPRQYADMKPIEIATFDGQYKMFFEPAENHDPDSQIAFLRDKIAKRQVIILKKNEALIRQLKNAIRDEKGNLTRSTEYGHWDAVMALVYMAHHAPWRLNPGFEKPLPYDWTKQQIPKGAFKEVTKGSRAFLRRSFRRRQW